MQVGEGCKLYNLVQMNQNHFCGVWKNWCISDQITLEIEINVFREIKGATIAQDLTTCCVLFVAFNIKENLFNKN